LRSLSLGSAEIGISPRAGLYDSLFLALVVVLSCVPYTGGLGLYSDDWGILASFHHSDGSYSGLLASIMMAVETRPVQGHVLAGLYWLFGLDITGYHVANCAGLATSVLLFYHSLRALRCGRTLALAVPLVFGLLPHYSTDRFWIAAFQANASILLYFLSLYADLRFVSEHRAVRWLWKALGTVALLASVLAYEVTAALFVVNVVVLLYVTGIRRHGAWVRSAAPTALGVASNVVSLALAIGYKFTTTARADLGGGLRYRVIRIFTEAAPVHFVEYGLALPVKVGRAVRDHPDVWSITVSILVGIFVGAYVLRVTRQAADRFDAVSWPAAAMAGAILFVAGYGVSLMTWEIGFHTTGANNRTAIGAAIGVAWVFVGIIGWASGRVSSERWRPVVFCTLVALLAAGSTLLTSTVGAFWVRAARQQAELIASIQDRLPSLSPGTTLLLDGICPFDGPAPVFATDWDMTGMLQLAYDDVSLRGDVIKPNTEVTEAGIRTLLFDDWINVHPYGDHLIVFHAGVGGSFELTSFEVARQYFDTVSRPALPACPPYTDGDGAAIF
jgi:hypothetical protein